MALWRLARLAWTARSVEREARAQNLAGLEFHQFGRRAGRRLLLKRAPEALQHYLAPVSSVRYFEFPFASRCLPKGAGRCVDVASPRLFSLFMAEAGRATSVRILNPDRVDAANTGAIVRALGLGDRIDVRCEDVRALRGDGGGYDAVWSLSVLEHVDGEYSDVEAVRWMWEVLRPGGRLILTVPVDRTFRTETRDADPYGTQERLASGAYFFQRLYDLAALRERIVDGVGSEPELLRWYGERVPGSYAEYERRWIERGLRWTVHDALEMRDRFTEFPSWAEMPGVGVCGLLFVKR